MKIRFDFFGATPRTAKQIRNIAGAIVVTAGALWGANKIGELKLSEKTLQVCQIVTIVGGAIGFGSQSLGETKK